MQYKFIVNGDAPQNHADALGPYEVQPLLLVLRIDIPGIIVHKIDSSTFSVAHILHIVYVTFEQQSERIREHSRHTITSPTL